MGILPHPPLYHSTLSFFLEKYRLHADSTATSEEIMLRKWWLGEQVRYRAESESKKYISSTNSLLSGGYQMGISKEN